VPKREHFYEIRLCFAVVEEISNAIEPDAPDAETASGDLGACARLRPNQLERGIEVFVERVRSFVPMFSPPGRSSIDLCRAGG
jgi:hypothetical protein